MWAGSEFFTLYYIVDLKNAFGSIFRHKMLTEIKARCPILYPYTIEIKIFLSERATPYVHPEVYNKETSVACIVRHRDSSNCHAFERAGTGRELLVPGRISILRKYFPAYGLELNSAKCKLFGLTAPTLTDPEFEGIPKVADGYLFLGTPVGDDAFVRYTLDGIVDKLQLLFSRLSSLHSSVAKFLILRAWAPVELTSSSDLWNSIMANIWQPNPRHFFASRLKICLDQN